MKTADRGDEKHAGREQYCVTVSLSGGGFRATAFTGGAMLALSDSGLGPDVASVSSVSGGSLTSALTVGGFPTRPDGGSMESNLRLVSGLVQTHILKPSLLKFLISFPLRLFLASLLVVVILSPYYKSSPAAQGFVLGAVFSALLLSFALFIGSVTTVLESVLAVQVAVERSLNVMVPRHQSLSEFSSDPVKRVFCATDVNSGEHILISAQGVIGIASSDFEASRPPALLTSDVVAASAGFPGLRPLVFSHEELGMGPSYVHSDLPRTRPVFSRGLIGALGVVAMVAPICLLLTRIFGLFATLPQLGFLVALVISGVVVAIACGRHLSRGTGLQLIDGGVCDNLGTAFAALTNDSRYGDLRKYLRLDPRKKSLFFIVDASKPLTPTSPRSHSNHSLKDRARGAAAALQQLVPLRFRVIGRAVTQLVGNANGNARRATIKHLLANGDAQGSVVSILEAPGGSESVWADLPERNSKVPTTLRALDERVVRDLVLHGYRLMEERIKPFASMVVKRSDDEIGWLASEEMAIRPESGNGPYETKKKRFVWSAGVGSAMLFVAAFEGITHWTWLFLLLTP